MAGERVNISRGAGPIHEARPLTIHLMVMQFVPFWRNALHQQDEAAGEAVLAATEGHDEAVIGGEVGEAVHDHAASRTVSSRSSASVSPVARSR